MNFRVLYTDRFRRELKGLSRKHRSLKADLAKLIDHLEESPEQGTPLGNNCFKIRMAITSKGKGKSGGARVITNVHVYGQTVYLLSIYDKSDRDSISDKELKAILKQLKQ